MGLIYCLDISASYEHMLKSIQKLEEILETPFLRGKPVLVVATKADLLLMDDSLQLYDIENAFRIEPMARKCGSRIKLCYSHLLDQNGTNATTGLLTGFKWLIQYIMVNYGNIQIRLKCDRNIQVSFRRQMSQISVLQCPSLQSFTLNIMYICQFHITISDCVWFWLWFWFVLPIENTRIGNVL